MSSLCLLFQIVIQVGKLVSMTAGMQIDSNKLWVGTTSKVIAAVNEVSLSE